MKTFTYQNITMGKEWVATRHDFVNLTPDNALPISEVQDFFNENLFQATNGDFTVDLGFYGTYHQNRGGNFVIYLIRGDFYTGELLEKITTRSKDEAVKALEQFMVNADRGLYKKRKGLGLENIIYKFKSLSVSRGVFNLF